MHNFYVHTRVNFTRVTKTVNKLNLARLILLCLTFHTMPPFHFHLHGKVIRQWKSYPLKECLPYRVSASQGCPPVSGVHLTMVSILHGCLLSRNIIPGGVFFLQGHPLYRGLPPYIWLFVLERCLPYIYLS